MWSSGRDNGQCGEKIWADPTCSGLTQADFAFTDIFSAFNNGSTGNLHPQAVITSPLEGDTFEPGDTVLLSANATDTDGAVVQVEFLADGASIGVNPNAPYHFSWINAPEGAHVITAVATDDQGAIGHSASIQITVGEGASLSTWNPSEIYIADDEVCITGKPGVQNGGPRAKNRAPQAGGGFGKRSYNILNPGARKAPWNSGLYNLDQH